MTINKSKKYDANFTAGGLLFNEFKALEEILLSDNFDELIQKEQEENNSIGIATNSARKRIISEIKRRNKMTPKDFWDHFFSWNEQEQKLSLFYLCLITYPLVLDIHLEVTVPKFKVSNILDPYDIQMRFDEISSTDDNVANWSNNTLDKLNSQYRTVLKEIDMLSKDRLQKINYASGVFWDYFTDVNEQWFKKACFL